VVADYFLIPPLYSWRISDPGDLVRMLLFCGVGLTITWVTDHIQRSGEAIRVAAAVVDSSADSIRPPDLAP
ncbi:MAG TPA: DUF4118 domain-containing protein, partial [Candidatus Angelobacter sp.]